MNEKDELIYDLKAEIEILKIEIAHLQKLLEKEGIEYQTIARDTNCEVVAETNEYLINENITQEQVDLFITLFHGRTDVYSKRFISKAGNVGYSPVCSNFWRQGVCPKVDKRKIKCYECANHNWISLSRKVIYNHLMGFASDCSDVIGVYPMLADETCYFLVFDFDNHDKENEKDTEEGANTDDEWITDVNAMREICGLNDVDVRVERSRSGKGAHIWIFFDEAIPASLARRFGTALLTKGAESVNQKNFKSYDRMLPAQDKFPEGGFGNLIALPMQGQALRNGNSAFINENWRVIADPWEAMKTVKKVSRKFVEDKINEWVQNGVLGVLADEMSKENDIMGDTDAKPWGKKKPSLLYKDDIQGYVEITLANQIYIKNHNIKPRALNRIRRLAAFNNPEYYKTQAMGFSTKGIPRILQCFSDTSEYVCLPRGCEEKLLDLLRESAIKYKTTDCRQIGTDIDVEFIGKLRLEQQISAEKMLSHDYGILGAATGFGKTAIGAYLIASRKVNALVLVHNREIMKNWLDDFEKFLEINEDIPEIATKRGKRQRKSIIGKLYAGHNSLNGIIDVAMISSFGKGDDINQVIKDYGLVIMDECHHAGAATHENVLKEVSAKYVYGLTATPKREDGHEPKMFMQFGPIRYRLTAKDRAKMQTFAHYVYPRFTCVVNTSDQKWGINDAYRAIIANERRNQQITCDILECIANHRTPLILTKFTEHAETLMKLLEGKVKHLFLLQGGRSNKERDRISMELKHVPEDESVALVAIGKYIGEGFNFPRLDTMMLAVPIAWQGNVEQYSGRLHRDYEGKEEVVIYDYVDTHIKVLEGMYHKRLSAYKKIGYEVCSNIQMVKNQTNAIFDNESYQQVYDNDLKSAHTEIVISSPGVNEKKVKGTIKLLREAILSGVKVTVITLTADGYPDNRVEITRNLHKELQEGGIYVKSVSEMHEHFVVVDREIVWYGSMNFLSREKEDDNLLRVMNKEIAEELLEMSFK